MSEFNNIIKIGINDGGISELVYEDSKGVKWYYVKPHLLSQDYQMYFSAIMTQIGLGIDSTELLNRLGEIEKTALSIDAKNITEKQREIIKLTTNIETKVSQLIPTKLFIAAISTVVFTEGENYRFSLPAITQKKESILEDSDATSFFTHFALVTLMNYNDSSRDSVQDYLKLVNLNEIIK